MSGNSKAAFTCVVDEPDVDEEPMRANGLTQRANAVRRQLDRAFGRLADGRLCRPGGVTNGHMKGSAHYEGRAIDIFFRPVSPENKRRRMGGGPLSRRQRRPARHRACDLRRPDLDCRGQIRGRLARLPPPDADGAGKATRVILEHRDHVHVDVA